ncbi:MAG: hypothetical protein ACI85I_000598 [Arenicella sp.]|jgi:hypothetical protein
MANDYKLKEQTSEQLVFKAGNSLWIFIILFGLIGGIPLVISLLSFVADGIIETESDEVSVMLLGFGLIFFSASMLMFASRFSFPKYFIFNHAKGALQIKHKSIEEEAVAEIPYTSIQSFGLRRKVSTSSSGSSGSSRSVSYIVSILKKDGSNWDLNSFSKESKALKLKSILETEVNLSTPISNPIPPKVPEDVQLVQSGGNISFLWRNKVTATYILVFFVLAGFGTIGFGVYLMDGSGVAVFVITGFILIVASLMIYKIYANLTTDHKLTITSDELQIIKNEKIKKQIPLMNIASIRLDFGESMSDSQIKILNHEQHDYVREKMDSKQIGLSDISDLISLAKNSITLEMDGLDMIGKIQMEQMLERIILEKGGVSVL